MKNEGSNVQIGHYQRFSWDDVTRARRCHYDVIMASLWRHIDIKIDFLSFFCHFLPFNIHIFKFGWKILKFAEVGNFGHPGSVRGLAGYRVMHRVTGAKFFSPSTEINFRNSCKKPESQTFRFSGYSAKTTWVGNFAPPPCGIGLTKVSAGAFS